MLPVDCRLWSFVRNELIGWFYLGHWLLRLLRLLWHFRNSHLLLCAVHVFADDRINCVPRLDLNLLRDLKWLFNVRFHRFLVLGLSCNRSFLNRRLNFSLDCSFRYLLNSGLCSFIDFQVKLLLNLFYLRIDHLLSLRFNFHYCDGYASFGDSRYCWRLICRNFIAFRLIIRFHLNLSAVIWLWLSLFPLAWLELLVVSDWLSRSLLLLL